MSHLDLVNNNLYHRDMMHEQLGYSEQLAEVKVTKHEQVGIDPRVTEDEDGISSRSKLLNSEHAGKQSKLKKSIYTSDLSLASNFTSPSSSSESASASIFPSHPSRENLDLKYVKLVNYDDMHIERQRHSDGRHGHSSIADSWLLYLWHKSADLFDRCLARGAFLKLFSALFYAVASFLIVVINKIILTNYR